MMANWCKFPLATHQMRLGGEENEKGHQYVRIRRARARDIGSGVFEAGPQDGNVCSAAGYPGPKISFIMHLPRATST